MFRNLKKKLGPNVFSTLRRRKRRFAPNLGESAAILEDRQLLSGADGGAKAEAVAAPAIQATPQQVAVAALNGVATTPAGLFVISQYEKILPPKPGVDKFVDEPEPGEPSPIYYDPFKPGASASGAALTFEQKVKSQSDDYLRKAWDKAVDVHGFFRDIRKEELAGHTYAFQAKKKRIMELSKLMHLTVHEQPANSASINQVDLVLAEGIAHGAKNAYEIGQKASVPTPADMKMPDPERFQIYTAFNKVIEDSIKAAGTITGNYADDKKLMDWMVAEYRKNI